MSSKFYFTISFKKKMPYALAQGYCPLNQCNCVNHLPAENTFKSFLRYYMVPSLDALLVRLVYLYLGNLKKVQRDIRPIN